MNDLSQYIINCEITIRDAFKQESNNKGRGVIVVDENNNVLGLVSDGDFRRAIWKGLSLEQPISSIMNNKFIYFNEGSYRLENIKQAFQSNDIMQILIIKDSFLVDLIFRDNFFEDKLHLARPALQMPVMIMAGGKGTRLDPFTRILPKPLIPIGDKPVIEVIMDKFAEYSISEFYISVNYKEKMIKAFFEDSPNGYTISYINEKQYLGTAGALKYLEGKVEVPFIVSNCDIIIDTDYNRISDFHREGNYDLTLVGSMQHHVIPYGVCRLKGKGELEVMEEKPEYDFLVNTGLYVLNPDVLSFIPPGKHFDMNDLIQVLQNDGRHVGVYPVSSESWIDVGQLEEYKKHLELIS